MNVEQLLAREFHIELNLPIREIPTVPTPAEALRMARLMQEEINEFMQAVSEHDVVKVADSLADIIYTAYTVGVQCGIDIEPIYLEIHKANMTKSGGQLSKAGKVEKPPGYKPPNLIPLIEAQIGRKPALKAAADAQ